MRRSTWILLVVVFLLLAAILLWERKVPTTGQRARNEVKLLSIESKKVNRLERRGFSPVVLVKDEKRWDMVEPVKDRADRYGVEGFIDRLVGARVLRVVKRGASSPEEMGLDKPRAVWTLKTNSGSAVVELGKEAPLGEGVYVRAAGRVVLLPKDMEKVVLRPSNNFRLRDLLWAGTQQVQRCDLVRRNGDGFSFKRSGDEEWEITTPFKDWGNGDKLQDLLDDLSLCQVFSFFPEGKVDSKASGLNKPMMEARLTLDNGQKIEVKLGNKVPDSDPGKRLVYASATGRPSIMSVSLNSLRFLKKSAGDYRSLECFRHALYDADGITVKGEAVVEIRRAPKKGWKFTIPKKPPAGADASVLAAEISELKGKEADELTVERAKDLLQPAYTVTIKGRDFQESLVVGREVDGKRYAKAGGRKCVLLLKADQWNRIGAALALIAKGGKVK